MLSIQLTSKDIKCYFKPAEMTNEAYINTLTTRSLFTTEDCMRLNNRQDQSENKVPSTCLIPIEALRTFLMKYDDVYVKNGQFVRQIGNAFNTCTDEEIQTLFSFDSMANLKQKLNLENQKFEAVQVTNLLRQFYMLEEEEMFSPCLDIDLMVMQTQYNQTTGVSFRVPYKHIFKSFFLYMQKRFNQEKDRHVTFIVPHAAKQYHIDFLRKVFDSCGNTEISFVNHIAAAFAYVANHQSSMDQKLKDGSYLLINVEENPEITLVKLFMGKLDIVETYFIDKNAELENQIKLAQEKNPQTKVLCVGRVKPQLTQALLQYMLETITVQNQQKAMCAGGVYFEKDAICDVVQKPLKQAKNQFDFDDDDIMQFPYHQAPRQEPAFVPAPKYEYKPFTYYDPQIEATKKVDNEDALNRQLPEVQKKFKVATPEFDVWHFTFMKIKDANLQGIYHFQLDLESYPHKAPSFKFLSENGVCPVNRNILYSDVNEIQEWQPYTPIVDIVQTIQNLILDPKARPQVTQLLQPSEEQFQQCAERSKKFSCYKCTVDHNEIVKKLDDEKKKKETSQKKVVTKTKVTLDLDDD